MTNKSGFFGIREIYASFILVATMIFVSIFSSMAVFQKTVEKVGVASLVANNVNQVLSSTESSFVLSTDKTYGTILVSSGSSKFFDITVTNDKNINTKYKLYYKFTSGVTVLNVEVGVSDQSLNSSSASLNKSGNDGNSKVIRVGIKNNSNQDVSIDIGAQGGYENNEVILLSGRNEMSIISESYKDNSGANSPKLAEGMIPVIYDSENDKWLKADTSNEWYDYDNQWWANAVTVTSDTRSTYQSASPLTEISMDDINTMWVWIPRYKYKIPSDIGASNGEDVSVNTPPQIDVIFESNIESTGVDESTYRSGLSSNGLNENYYTHPSFRNIDNIVYSTSTQSRGAWNEEITGIWVGKFETGGTTNSPLIKPNITSLTNQTLSTLFRTSIKIAGGDLNDVTGEVTFAGNVEYGLTSNTDTHLMKSTEWGAVVYLSQSQYGKNGNDIYTEKNKEIYQNKSDTYVTGLSNGTPPSNTINTQCTYNDIIDRGNGTGACGAGASTTGNIYGIYDMSGGAAEYTMGTYSNEIGNSGFSVLPNAKYYDSYVGTGSTAYGYPSKAIFGDATWETVNWYSNQVYYPNANKFITHGSTSGSSKSGVFSTFTTDGGADNSNAFRIVLIP